MEATFAVEKKPEKRPTPAPQADPAPQAAKDAIVGTAVGTPLFLVQRQCATCSGDDDTLLQPALAVNEPGDVYEQEAEAVANLVMRQPAAGSTPTVRRCACGGAPRGHPPPGSGPDAECPACRARRLSLQRQAQPSGPGRAPASVLPQGGGHPLPTATRRFFEQRFGQDFSPVRIHSDSQADARARAVQARAFTAGRDIVFAAGQYAPETTTGQHLLAHELTHVVQQGVSRNTPQIQRAPPAGMTSPDAPASVVAPEPVASSSPGTTVEFEGRTLSGSPSQIRSVLWPIFQDQGAAELANFQRRFTESIEADRREIQRLQAEESRQRRFEEEYNRNPGDIPGGVPWNPDMYANLQGQIRQIEARIAAKERIRPILGAQAERVRNEPTITPGDLETIGRLQGSHSLYNAVDAYRTAARNLSMARTLRSSARDPAMAAESISYLEDQLRAREGEMQRLLSEQGFANLDDFTRAVTSFESFFQRYALQTAFAMLAENEQLVQAEQTRYGGAVERNPDVTRLHSELAPVRIHAGRARTLRRDSMMAQMGPGMAAGAGDLRRADRAIALAAEAAAEEQQARAQLQQLGQRYPVLLDPSINLDDLTQASPQALQSLVQNTAGDRLSDIARARTLLTEDPEAIWEAEGALERARQSLGIRPGTVYHAIIEDKLRAIEHRRMIRDIFLAALAIGFGLLTGGTGTVAVVGAVGAAAVGVTTAALHVQEYRMRQAFVGSAFDRARSLSANEPSLFWLAVDIAGAVLDLGAAVQAFRRLAPLARAAASAAGETRGAAAAGEAAVTNLRREGNAIQEGLGDRLAANAQRARSDQGFLETTRRATSELSPTEVQRELEIARRSGERRLLSGNDYVEEIALPNGHTWRRTPDGRWCRFSSGPLCFLLGEGPEAGSVREVGRSTAGIRDTEADAARAALRGNLGTAPFDGAQAHHIVPLELRNHPLIDELRRNYGWDINGATNGIHLPTRPGTPGAGTRAVHAGSHPRYSSMIESRLDQLYQQWRYGQVSDSQLLPQFEAIVGEYRARLVSGTLTLR